jgi:hypothetical protein
MLTKQQPRDFGADDKLTRQHCGGQCILSGAAHILISAPRTNGKHFWVRNAMSRSSAAWISKDSRTQKRNIYGQDCAKY